MNCTSKTIISIFTRSILTVRPNMNIANKYYVADRHWFVSMPIFSDNSNMTQLCCLPQGILAELFSIVIFKMVWQVNHNYFNYDAVWVPTLCQWHFISSVRPIFDLTRGNVNDMQLFFNEGIYYLFVYFQVVERLLWNRWFVKSKW